MQSLAIVLSLKLSLSFPPPLLPPSFPEFPGDSKFFCPCDAKQLAVAMVWMELECALTWSPG